MGPERSQIEAWTKSWFGPVHRSPILPSRQVAVSNPWGNSLFRSNHPWSLIRCGPVLRRLHVGFVTRTFAARPDEDHARTVLGQCRCSVDLANALPFFDATSSSCSRYRPFPTSKAAHDRLPIALATRGGSRGYRPVEPNGSQPPRIATRSSRRASFRR